MLRKVGPAGEKLLPRDLNPKIKEQIAAAVRPAESSFPAQSPLPTPDKADKAVAKSANGQMLQPRGHDELHTAASGQLCRQNEGSFDLTSSLLAGSICSP